MSMPLVDRLAALAAMSPAALRAEWGRVHRAPAPDLTPDLLARGLAHRLQERALGKVPAALGRELDRLAREYVRSGELTPRGTGLKPGTQLVRDWGGEAHHVLITEHGFTYRDRRYASLSRIAREITGVPWSGPRFFGLRARMRRIGGGAVGADANAEIRVGANADGRRAHA